MIWKDEEFVPPQSREFRKAHAALIVMFWSAVALTIAAATCIGG